MTKPKILVTSAAGRTGSATVRQLLEREYSVRAFEQIARRYIANPMRIHPGLSLGGKISALVFIGRMM